jgi:Putative papain-like cysteine peptidase (DUF1796)
MLIKHVISLGGNCHTSMFMKDHGLKRYSCPFDWIGLGLDEINNILETRFSRFIDPVFLIDHAEGDPRKCGHALYGDRLFHHFNPRVTEHRDYYLRCIERFCKRPPNPKDNILYIYQSFYADPSIEELKRLRDNLAIYRGNKSFLTLVLIHHEGVNKEKGVTEFKVKYSDPTLFVLYVDLIGAINGVRFLDRRDDDAMRTFLARSFQFYLDHPDDEALQREKMLASDIAI